MAPGFIRMTGFMISESVKATTAEESRYRIRNPNSKGRVSLVLGLEPSSSELLAELASQEWNGARFRSVIDPEGASDDLVLRGPDGFESRLSDELADVDVVVMFARSGEAAKAAAIVGDAAFGRCRMTGGFVLDPDHDRARLEKTLSAMRPFVISLVVGSDAESFSETLTAIRA